MVAGTPKEPEEVVRRVLETVVRVLESGGDPFAVDVGRLFEELREVLPELGEWGLTLDAEAVRRLAELVRKQEEWVEGKVSTLSLGPFLALVKLAALGPRELTLELLKAWRPAVSLDRMSLSDLLKGLEYLGSRGPHYPPEPEALEVPELAFEVSVPNLENVLREVREELKSALTSRGRVSYFELVRGDALRAYALSVLCSEGAASLEVEPLSGEVFVVPPRKGEYESVAVVLKGVGGGARAESG